MFWGRKRNQNVLNWGQVLETQDCSRRLCLFPTCQVRISRFYLRVASAFSFFSGSLGLRPYLRAPDLLGLNDSQISGGTAGPQSRPPEPSGHCRTSRAPDLNPQCQTSTASARSQLALPDLNRERQISVGTARPQPRAPDLSRHCQTSTVTARSQWALPPQPQVQDLSWHCQTSNRERQISVGTARPQPRAPDLSRHCQTSTVSAR